MDRSEEEVYKYYAPKIGQVKDEMLNLNWLWVSQMKLI